MGEDIQWRSTSTTIQCCCNTVGRGRSHPCGGENYTRQSHQNCLHCNCVELPSNKTFRVPKLPTLPYRQTDIHLRGSLHAHYFCSCFVCILTWYVVLQPILHIPKWVVELLTLPYWHTDICCLYNIHSPVPSMYLLLHTPLPSLAHPPLFPFPLSFLFFPSNHQKSLSQTFLKIKNQDCWPGTTKEVLIVTRPISPWSTHQLEWCEKCVQKL